MTELGNENHRFRLSERERPAAGKGKCFFVPRTGAFFGQVNFFGQLWQKLNKLLAARPFDYLPLYMAFRGKQVNNNKSVDERTDMQSTAIDKYVHDWEKKNPLKRHFLPGFIFLRTIQNLDRIWPVR